MKKPTQKPDWLEKLRLLADKSLGKGKGKDLAVADVLASMHELQVHQTELEIQNEELKRTRLELEDWKDKHLELYEFLPSGYFILDKQTRILEVNLSGATLLGVERGSLVGRRFQIFVEKYLLPEFNAFHNRTLASDVKQVIELRLVKNDATPLCVHLEGIAFRDGEEGVKRCLFNVTDITARKLIEQRMECLVSILDATPDFVGFSDSSGTYLSYINPAGRTMVGIGMHEDVTQIKIADVHPERMHKLIRDEILPTAIRDGQWIGECAFLHRDGREVPVHMVVLSHKSPDGKLERFSTISRDITERKRAEDALRTSEARYERAINGANDGIWEWELTTGKCYLSPCYKRLLGFEDHELPNVPESFFDRIHPEDKQWVGEVIRAHLEEHKPSVIEARLRCKSGEYRWFYGRGQAIWDEQGKPLLMAGSITDVTERKRAEELLRESEEKYRAIFDGAAEGIFVTDVETLQFYFVNRAGHRMFGYTEEDFRRLKVPDMFATEDLDSSMKGFAVHVRDEKSFADDLVCLHKDGSKFYANINSSLMTLNDRPCIIGMFTDVTKRRKAEDMAKIKSEFLSNMSHEVRTPLNAIIGLTRLALDTELNLKQTDYLRKVLTSSMSLLNIINDILDFSKIEANRLKIENINVILAETVENTMDMFVEKANEKGLKLTYKVDSDVPAVVTGDPYRLGQVLNNIIGNAVKFTGKGEIHLKVEAAERTDESCVLRFTVTDTGIGLSAEHIHKLFTPFQQADGSISRKYGGTGLGLAISKRLVNLMGGDFSVSSELGKGSSFAFTVRFGVSKSQGVASDFVNLHAMKVMVVDDSPSALEVLGRYLEGWKFDVTLCSSGEECLRQLELADKAEKPFQLLLLDWNMPNMTGLDVAKKIHEDVAQGRLTVAPVIIMITGYSEEHLHAEAAGIKLDAMLTKPLRASRLYNTILRLQQPGIRQFTLCPLLQENLRLSTKALQGARLLLVEDNDINQQVAFEMLSKIGIHVVIANNGYEALEMAENEAFDGILMDLQMPGMDGYQTTALIKEKPGCKDIPIIAMSAAVMEEDKQKCISVGMVDHVAKPIMPEELTGALLKWIKPARKGFVAASPDELPELEGYNVPPNLPGFNLLGAIQRLGGNKKLLCELLHKFCEDYASTPGKLDNLAQACDVNGTLTILHSLKGVSGSLGISMVYDHVIQLENRIKAGQFPVSFETLDHVLHDAFVTISQTIKKPAKPINPRAEYDQEDAAKRLNELAATLKKHKIYPKESLEELTSRLAVKVSAELLSNLGKHVDNFNYKGALVVVHEIAGNLGITINM